MLEYGGKKMLFFLRSLQKLSPLIQMFSDLEFRSFLMFLVVNLRKEKRSWILSIAVGEEFYKHTFPFIFSDSPRTSTAAFSSSDYLKNKQALFPARIQ